MALTVFKQGEVLKSAGDRMDSILFVAKGSVSAQFLGRKFAFGQGDLIGLDGFDDGEFKLTYTAETDVTAFVNNYESIGDLEKLLKSSEDLTNKIVGSLCRQASEMSKLQYVFSRKGSAAYELLTTANDEYKRLCALYAFTAKDIGGLDAIKPLTEVDGLGDWLNDYYPAITKMDATTFKDFFADIGISVGFLRTGFAHFRQLLASAAACKKYLEEIALKFISAEGSDLLSVVSELHTATINVKGADDAVGGLVKQIGDFLQGMPGADQALLAERWSGYEEAAAAKRGTEALSDAPSDSEGGVKQNLKDSLYEILEYSEIAEEDANRFARNIHDFTLVRDRTSTEDHVYRMRREITNDFFKVYTPVFLKSLRDNNVPTVIKMFLNFGYMDAALAGMDNADYLYSIADSYKGDPSRGVYTIVEWLTAIYNGDKEPSQGDLDTDYASTVKEIIQSKRLHGPEAEKEEKRLLADREGKMRFELESVFPIGNKITFGRVTSYVPVFADSNVQRGLKQSLVTADKLSDIMEEILSLDFSAFNREVVYSNPELEINSTQLDISIMPNFILMPNVGVRGALWQEIEGRNRGTNARMFLPIFYLEDLKQALIRLAGEFRWEMCKRVQGARWSDATYPSLTSEYFTYLQFYRNNKDLSMDAKSSVKTEIMRARNVYRAVFVNNYTDWLMYECNGSQRLNKVARKIMAMYCPFPEEIRERLATNPQYSEPLKLRNLQNKQAVQKLANMMQKVEKMGKPVPQELQDQMKFLEK
ncbi:MAG: hypothetical protein FWB98_04365 [Defluviitaleaceae bacterium]|nr:hypothetical protein [Defluviitaleaceae bacterium]